MFSSPSSKLFLWRESVLYLGPSLDPQMHSHHAVQCCIALKGELSIRGKGGDRWGTCPAAIIGANVPHSITSPDGPLCLLYLEKTSNNYRSMLDYHCLTPKCHVRSEPLILNHSIPSKLRDTLLQAMNSKVLLEDANKLKMACLEWFQGRISKPQALDTRISRLLLHIHSRPGETINGDALADIACLSESRMQHLFKQQLGIPIRRYLLWVRLRHVLELALMGSALTVAAHESGFSDLAHFSRTFKAMFGIAPSSLLAPGAGVTPMICE